MTEDQRTSKTLSDVVRERRLALGLSTRTLAERCIDPESGTALPRHYIDRLENNVPSLTPPRLPELRALAAGLNLPLAVIQDAAGYQFHGVTTQHSVSGRAWVVAAAFEELDPAEQDRFLAVWEAFKSTKPKPE
ncbi:helix-turn-helix domain-containing protein [Streptomyces sp. NPDC056549]|uniref:helix-turn-helix domain-containing protein n=1 Tax=Streptomyces sp. NPDC056549 TaxID=3345864 RepID=UPI003677C6BD